MPHKNSSGRIFWGFILIVVGVLFLLDQMGRLDFGDLLSRYWPLILVLAGIWQLIASNFSDWVGGLFLIIAGGYFQLAKLEILGHNVWHYAWPLLIILLGLWVLSGAFRRRPEPKFPSAKEDDLDAFAMLSAFNRRIESQNFRGGKATAIMGGVELDFTGARLAGGRAAIELTAIMGGIDIRVPRSFRVEVEAHPILGGVDDKHTFVPGPEGDQLLHIKATAILGGIDIKD
jgi:predicted membrane protein